MSNFFHKNSKIFFILSVSFLFLLSISIPLSKTGITICYISLLLLSVFLCVFSDDFRVQFFSCLVKSHLSKAVVPLLIVCILGIFYSTDLAEAWGRASNIANLFLISLLISVFLEKFRIKGEYLLITFVFSLFFLCLVGFAQVYVLKNMPLKPFRPLGMHQIWFANLISIGLYISFLFVCYARKLSFSLPVIFVLIFFILLALCSIILSTCRGAWFAIIFTFGVYSCLLLFQKKRKLYFLLSFIFLLLLCLIFYKTQVVKYRINQAISDIKQYQQGHVSTSIGSRFVMWHVSWEIFKDNPFFGVGIGDYNLAVKELVRIKKVPRFIIHYNQPHNVYFFVLATLGIVGFLSFVWMIIYILIVSFRYIVFQKNPCLAWISLLVTIHLSLASFFDTLFFIYTLSFAYGFVLGCTIGRCKDNYLEGVSL